MTDGSSLEREVLALRSRAHNYFDLEALKRWFGTPPILEDTDMEKFDEFMLALAKCIPEGNKLIAVFVYQYGSEQFKMIELLKLHSEAFKRQPALAGLVHNIERKERRIREGDQELVEDLVEAEDGTPEQEKFWIEDSALANVNILEAMANEIALADQIERNLQICARIDRLMEACSKRASEALRRIRTHSQELAEQLEAQFWELVSEEQHKGRE
jgi:hypothetical protein